MSITHEIGGLGREQDRRPTETQIIAFCDNLRESMLRQFREGQALSIEQKYDNQTEYTEYGMPPDAVCMGVTISVHFGRPALRSKAAEALGRAVAKRARRRAGRPVDEPLAEATPRLVLTVTDDAEDYPVEGDDVPPAKAETWRDRPPLV